LGGDCSTTSRGSRQEEKDALGSLDLGCGRLYCWGGPYLPGPINIFFELARVYGLKKYFMQKQIGATKRLSVSPNDFF
jgi:hypothetical protein